MNKIRLIVIEQNQEESFLFQKRAKPFIEIELISTVVYYPGIIETISLNDADVVAVNIRLPRISAIVSELKKKIHPAKILLLCEFVQPDLILECLFAGAGGYVEKCTSNKKFEQSVKDCFESTSLFPLNIVSLLYSKIMLNDGEPIRKKVFQLFSKGFLLKDVVDQTGLTEEEIRKHVNFSFQL